MSDPFVRHVESTEAAQSTEVVHISLSSLSQSSGMQTNRSAQMEGTIQLGKQTQDVKYDALDMVLSLQTILKRQQAELRSLLDKPN